MKDIHETDLDNDDEMVGRILTRREVMALAGSAGLTMALGGPAFGQGTQHKADLIATPQVTEGPFFVDEKLNRSDLTTDCNRDEVTRGLPLLLNVKVLDIRDGKGKPLSGAHVDIWHCDTVGVYSDEDNQPGQDISTGGQKFLRGYQVTDKNGAVKFKTIYPGCYFGRAVHIHFKVRTFSKDGETTHEFTSQFFFDEAHSDKVYENEAYKDHNKRYMKNSQDGIYSARQADGTPVGSHLKLNIKPSADGKSYAGSFVIGLALD